MEGYVKELLKNETSTSGGDNSLRQTKRKTNILMEFAGRGDKLTKYPTAKSVLTEVKKFRERYS